MSPLLPSPRVRRVRRHAVALGAALAACVALRPAPLVAQPAVPGFRDVTGHAIGERITVHAEAMRYLERLAATSPRVRLVRMGRSWERRDLVVAIVSDPANLARLDEIRATSLALGAPTTPALLAQARGALATQPVVAWLGGSIHGNELSGSEALLQLLEHLTTRDDAATREVLQRAVVMIDVMLNPDGRDMFAQQHHDLTGEVPSALGSDASRDFGGFWSQGFRGGHYFFDTNRDWFAQTQREIRDRMPTLHAWRPQVAIDLHEQDVDGEFFFDPPGDPVNPSFPAFSSRWFGIFGQAYAAAFDSAGFEYMTRERYNYFYPGYTSNRGYQGAVAMLFEQGSTRGLRIERGDGTVRTLAQAARQQYTAAWTALRTIATRREQLLTEYLESQRRLVADGDGGLAFVLPIDPRRPGLLRELVATLERNDIAVDSVPAGLRLVGATDRAGLPAAPVTLAVPAYVVRTTQAAGRLARTLLQRETPMDSAFLRRAREFTDRAENPRFYDITAWSLPLLFDVDAYTTTVAAVAGRTVPRGPAAARPAIPRAGYAWLLDGSQPGAMAALWQLRDRGHRAGVLTAPSRFGGRTVNAGSVIVRAGQNDAAVHAVLDTLARRHALDVLALETGLADSGYASLGSGDFSVNVKPVTVGILMDEGIAGLSFGFAWYTLDAQYGIPVSLVRTRSVAGLTGLSRFDVLVLPDAQGPALAAALGEGGVRRLEQWVRDGGTLVAIGGGADWARTQLKLALRSWYDTDAGKGKAPIAVPGTIYRAALDTRHWMTAGARASLPVLVNSSRLWLRPVEAASPNRHVLATVADSLPLSGHAWQETTARIRGSVLLYEERVGAGRVIAFAEDPNFRGYWRGANRLFLNAVVLAPSGRGP